MSTYLHPVDRLDAILRLDPQSTTPRLVLRGLHSMLRVSPVRTVGFLQSVKLLHASLSDFLLDPVRSSGLCGAAPDLDPSSYVVWQLSYPLRCLEGLVSGRCQLRFLRFSPSLNRDLKGK